MRSIIDGANKQTINGPKHQAVWDTHSINDERAIGLITKVARL